MLKKQTPLSYLQFMKRISTFFLIVVAATSLSGCIAFLTELKVKGDGSGTMVQTITMNPEQMKETMENIAKQMGATTTETKEELKKETPNASKEELFKEDDLKAKSADMGQGVTFVSAEKIDTKTAIGVRVTYAFKDINQLAMNPKPEAAMGTAAAGASSQDALKFRFNRTPAGNSVLTIIFPPAKPETKEQTKEQAATPPPPASPEELAQQTAMIRQMFKGLRMGITIDVEGKVVKTNSPYVEGSKITLMDINFDPIFSDEEGFKELSKKLEKTMGDDRKTMEVLKGVKGFKIVTDPEVSIEFAPK